MRQLRLVIVSAAALAAAASPGFAQCPDGTPPPCAALRGRAPVLDPNRIAVLPFRVTTADTLLGEGVAELLAGEFTGPSGPRAAHMGSVIRAWRQAGGGPRTPLAQAAIVRVARSIGAGLVVDGSIVGLGPRLTVSATVLTVATGQGRRVPPVSGSADSLEALLRRLSANLLAVTGGRGAEAERSRLTDSPEAMRAYLEGLAAWRRRDYAAAKAAFERALAEDSSFAAAAYRRLLAARYFALEGERTERWEALAWRHQDGLNREDRVVLRAILGTGYPAHRTFDAQLADLEVAVREAPESPEANYELGDGLLHYAQAAGIRDAYPRMVQLLDRSLALDTQSTVLAHLVWAAANHGDTATLRRAWTGYEGFLGDRFSRALAWVVGGMLGDRRLLDAARRSTGGVGGFVFYGAGFWGLSASAADEMYAHALRVLPNDTLVRLGYLSSALLTGRSSAACRAAEALTVPGSELSRDVMLILGAVVSDGDTAAASQAARRLAQRSDLSDPSRARAQCAIALWAMSRESASGAWDDGMLRSNGQLNCAVMLDLLRAARLGLPDLDARIVAAESLVREHLAYPAYAGFENVLFARLWEARGDAERALAAARRLNISYLPFLLPAATSARLEGRLAAQTGDTAGAVRAYRRYLWLRRDAEPPLVPQRDSVRAALAALERR
jgi:hypothetical protein